MNTIRLQLRFLLPLLLALGAAAYLASGLLDRLTWQWFARDLNNRGALIANTLADSVSDSLAERRGMRLQALFDRAAKDERLFAIGLCGENQKLIRKTASFPRTLTCASAQELAKGQDPRLVVEGGPVHVGVHHLELESGQKGSLVLLHDVSYAELRSQDTQRYLLIFMGVLGIAVALITVVVAQLSWRGWVSGARALLRGEGLLRPVGGSNPELEPLAADLRARLRDLEDEYRRAQGQETGWNPERLRTLLQTQLRAHR